MVFAIMALLLADGVHVTPDAAWPGQTVHISVPDCAVGQVRHTATSSAFAHAAALYGKADTGEADTMIKKGLAPGSYRIAASCGPHHTVLGQVVVAGRRRPAAPSHGDDNWALPALLVLAAGGGAVLLAIRLRRRH